MSYLATWSPVWFRAMLYVGLEVFPILYVAFRKWGTGEEKWNTFIMIAVICNSMYHACIGLRAYTDTSFSRLGDAIRQKTGDTERFTRKP